MSSSNFILPKFYRRFALIFFALALVLLVFVAYLIWARVKITITPVQEEVKQEFTFEVKDNVIAAEIQKPDVVAGKIEELGMEDNDFFNSTGVSTNKVKSTMANVGEVNIINNYSKDQTLVATTRLADPAKPDKVLVRLAKTITVPAGGKIKVQVYTDDPDNFKDLAPMRFIIPGLAASLQEKIYAENEVKLSKSTAGGNLVLAEDLENAQNILKERIYSDALAKFNKDLNASQSLWPKLVKPESIDVSYSAKVGDQVPNFSATIKFKAIAIAFDENQVLALAKEKFKNNLPAGRQLAKIEARNLSYEIQDFSLDQKTAKVKVVATGRSVISKNIDFLNKDNLLGKTEEQVRAYFSSYSQIKSVEIEFYPSWLKKTPRIKDKIQIEISQ